MKGQIFEIFGFLILAIAVIGIIVLIRYFLVGSYSKTIMAMAERHVYEEVHAGVNAIFFMTEEKSGRSLMELVGIAAYTGNDTINFGPGVGDVDVVKELEWRMNGLYGKGHWHITVPYPDITPDVQIVMVLDSSASMCYAVKEISEKMPALIENFIASGKKVSATLYILPGGADCCNGYKLQCSNQFPEKSYFHCRQIDDIETKCVTKLARGGNQLGVVIQTDEDYGHGIACAIEAGPVEEWSPLTIKLGIVISDELPEGSECFMNAGLGCCPGQDYVEQHSSLEAGIKSAKENKIPIFPIQQIDFTDSSKTQCATICQKCTPGSNCPGGFSYGDLTSPQCQCTDLVTQYHQEMASSTGGKAFTLDSVSATDIIDKINQIITGAKPVRKPNLEAGSAVPSLKNTRVVEVLIPVSVSGIYTKAYITQWA